VVFALNLFGAFEIFAPTGSLSGVAVNAAGPRRSFFEGLLAVLLATPCSAPFLGTAVGFAFAGSAATIVAIFSAIGVGLASPFVAITLVPAWARFMPRSGAWMGTLRAGLGFAVLATVVWLLWVVGRLVGTDGVAALLAFLVAVAFAAWGFGQLQAAQRLLPARVLALAAIVAGGLMLSAMPFEAAVSNAADEPAADGTRSWDPDELSQVLAAGQPAFVYFTADWCITCKVNERGTLSSEPVRTALDTLGFRVFKGDWTRRDAAIAEELARFGKGGVPMYLVYDPDQPEHPAVLPELLTPSRLVEALRAAAPGI
jgi:thiol:disulfide interchange protein DsbD